MNASRNSFRNGKPATRTGLARALGFNLHNLSASFFRFARKIGEEFSPTGIGYGFADVFTITPSLSYHSLNVEGFNVDRAVIRDIVPSEFFQEIIALVYNAFMRLSDKMPCFLSTLRAFLTTRKYSLPTTENIIRLFEKLRVGSNEFIRINREGATSDINRNGFIRLRKLFSRHVITRKRHKPFASRGSANGNGFDSALNRTGKKEFQATNVCETQVSPFKFPARLGKSKRIVSMSRLKPRESRILPGLHATEERLVGKIKSLDDVLQALSVHGCIFRECLSQLWHLVDLVEAGKRFTSLRFVGDYPLLKSSVVQRTTKFQTTQGVRLCLPIQRCSILKGASHWFLRYSSIARRIISATLIPCRFDSRLSLAIIW